MAVASLIFSFMALLAAAWSTLYARRIWLIERGRDQGGRRPRISAEFEDYGDDYPCLEVTNNGNEDLASVTVQLREPLAGYVRPISALSAEGAEPAPSVELGALASAETKRIRAYRDHPDRQFGEAIIYAHCSAADGAEWRVTVKTEVPRGEG
jgi:hypothetical protein